MCGTQCVESVQCRPVEYVKQFGVCLQLGYGRKELRERLCEVLVKVRNGLVEAVILRQV